MVKDKYGYDAIMKSRIKNLPSIAKFLEDKYLENKK